MSTAWMSKGSTRDPLLGARIDGRYRIRSVHGRGGMGVVYAALHEDLRRDVAIKVLDKSWASDRTAIERFLQEARTASGLSHGNIVDVLDLGRLPDGRPYLVMPLIVGSDLATVLAEEGPQHPKRVAALLGGVASALDLIHAKGLVHHDIKPENLMRVRREDGSETVVVLDFGIAGARFPLDGRGMELFDRGTPEFMPPEAASGVVPDRRGDIYALATVAFELMTGRLPFESNDDAELATLKATRPPSSMTYASGISFPLALEAVVARGLATRPAERYPTAGEFVRRLAHVAAQLSDDFHSRERPSAAGGPVLQPPSTRPQRKAITSRSRTLMAAGGLAKVARAQAAAPSAAPQPPTATAAAPAASSTGGTLPQMHAVSLPPSPEDSDRAADAYPTAEVTPSGAHPLPQPAPERVSRPSATPTLTPATVAAGMLARGGRASATPTLTPAVLAATAAVRNSAIGTPAPSAAAAAAQPAATADPATSSVEGTPSAARASSPAAKATVPEVSSAPDPLVPDFAAGRLPVKPAFADATEPSEERTTESSGTFLRESPAPAAPEAASMQSSVAPWRVTAPPISLPPPAKPAARTVEPDADQHAAYEPSEVVSALMAEAAALPPEEPATTWSAAAQEGPESDAAAEPEAEDDERAYDEIVRAADGGLARAADDDEDVFFVPDFKPRRNWLLHPALLTVFGGALLFWLYAVLPDRDPYEETLPSTPRNAAPLLPMHAATPSQAAQQAQAVPEAAPAVPAASAEPIAPSALAGPAAKPVEPSPPVRAATASAPAAARIAAPAAEPEPQPVRALSAARADLDELRTERRARVRRATQEPAADAPSLSVRPKEPKAVGGRSPAELSRQAEDAILRGELGSASELYDQAIKADSSYAPAFRGKGLVLERLGKTNQAADAFRTYLRLSPDSPAASKIRERLEAIDSK